MEGGPVGALAMIFFSFHLNSGLAAGVLVPCSLEEVGQHLSERTVQAQMERDPGSVTVKQPPPGLSFTVKVCACLCHQNSKDQLQEKET